MASFPLRGAVEGQWTNAANKQGTFGLAWDITEGSSTPIRISNGGKNVHLAELWCGLEQQMFTVDFSFGDVKGHVVLFPARTGVELQGTFKSRRDRGHYVAVEKKSKRGHDEGASMRRTRARPGSPGGGTSTGPGTGTGSSGSSGGGGGGSGRFHIESLGTDPEPVFVVRNADGRRGEVIRDRLRDDFHRHRLQMPTPVADELWESWRAPGAAHGRSPVSASSLNPLADSVLAQLRMDHPGVKLVTARDRGYSSRDVLVYSGRSGKGKHRDAQPRGSLVFVFCAGLSCDSSAWPAGSKVSIRLDSGDCMVFEGKTLHQVHACIPGTSPFPSGDWLGNRRLSTLVRQRPPTAK